MSPPTYSQCLAGKHCLFYFVVFHKALSSPRMLTAYFVLHKRTLCKFLIEATELSMPVFTIYTEWSRWHLPVILAHAR